MLLSLFKLACVADRILAEERVSLPVTCCRLNVGTSKESGNACLGSRLAFSSALPLLTVPRPSLHHGFDLRIDSASVLMSFHLGSSLAAALLGTYGQGCHCESSSLQERNLQHSHWRSKSLITGQSMAEQLSWCNPLSLKQRGA